MSTPTDYEADYLLLHARPGCDLDELKRAYRLEVRRLHPDRNPTLVADRDAQSILSNLNLAYGRLADYHRAHGHLPLAEREVRPTRVRDSVAASAAPVARQGPALDRRIPLAIAGMAVGLLVWSFVQAPDDNAPPIQNEEKSLRDPVVAARLTLQEPVAADAPVKVEIGDSKRRVRQILGAPILTTPDAWEYGPSYVKFSNGRVVDWYSSPLNPIAVDESTRTDPSDTEPPDP